MKHLSDKRLKVLITSPSLDASDNISGISTLVSQIIEHGDSDFIHFIAGRKDLEKAGAGWMLKQFFLPFEYCREINGKKVDIVHINTSFSPLAILRDALLVFAARRLHRPVLLHIHGGRLLSEGPGWGLQAIAKFMLRAANKVVVLSETEKNTLLKISNKTDSDVLPNAVAAGKGNVRKGPGGTKTIIFLGRIHKSKGLDEIIDACRLLTGEGIEFRFRCFGTGPQQDQFKNRMTGILGDSFSYEGIAAAGEKRRAFEDSDIFVLPSRYEGLPVSLLEAMAAGCVAVVSDVGSISSVIEDGVNGFLVPPENADQLVDRLRELLVGDVDWQGLRENARKTIEDGYSIEKYVIRLSGIYRSLIDQPRNP